MSGKSNAQQSKLQRTDCERAHKLTRRPPHTLVGACVLQLDALLLRAKETGKPKVHVLADNISDNYHFTYCHS